MCAKTKKTEIDMFNVHKCVYCVSSRIPLTGNNVISLPRY